MRLIALCPRSGRTGPDLLPLPDPVAVDPDALSGQGDWTQARLRSAEALWGEGYLFPGGAGEVRRLAMTLRLSASSSLLLLGMGSGGPTLTLAGELGVWVQGCESDPYLAAVAARRIQRAGVALAKRASAERWNPALPDFGRRRFDHAVTLDALRAARPDDVLAALAQAVKPGGQIALMETVAPALLDRSDPAVAAWLRLERRDSGPPDPASVARTLERLGLALHGAEDISARHMRQAVRGWRRRLRDLQAEHPDAARAAVLVEEAELWLRRVRLMRAGQIRMMLWLVSERGRAG